MSVRHCTACTSNMNLPLPWIARSYRTRPRIKKKNVKFGEFFFFQPCPSSPYVIRCHHFFSTLRGKNVFFHHRSPVNWRYGQRIRFFLPLHHSIDINPTIIWTPSRFSHCSVQYLFFLKKKVLLNRWKHGSGKKEWEDFREHATRFVCLRYVMDAKENFFLLNTTIF